MAVFPPWETLPHERLSPQPATVGRRLAVLDRLRRRELRIVIAPVRAVLQPMDPRLIEREPLRLSATWSGGLTKLGEELQTLGYSRTPVVTARGEYAVRGGLVDVFPTAADHPVRVEFWGDDIDEIRTFSAADQRTLETVAELTVHAARELIVDHETIGTAKALAATIPALADQLGMLADGVVFEGIEGLVTAIHPTPAHLPGLMGDGAGLVVIDPVQTHDRATQLIDQAAELMIADWETLAVRSADGRERA